MDFSKWILFLCLKFGSALENKALVFIPEMSAVTLPELWQMAGMSYSSPYIRAKRIDKWNWWTPLEITLYIEDFNSKSLALIRANTTESTNNLTDLLSFHKQQSMNPFTMPYHVNIGVDGSLIFADPNDISSVYFVHWRFNSTSTVNCFTKTGMPFLLTDAMNVLQNQQVVIYSGQFVQANGSTELLVKLNSFTQIHYMNGLSVYNPNNTYTKYKVSYSNWQASCQKGVYQDLTSTFTHDCDDSVQDTGNVKASCVWIFFDESITTVDVTVFGPAEDFVFAKSIQIVGSYDKEPYTASTNPSSDVTESSDQNMYVVADRTCECACDIYNSTTLSEEEIEEIQEKIKKELSVDVENLSSTIRKKISADDPRPSSTGIGYVGACVIAFTVVMMVVSDVVSFFKIFYCSGKNN